MHPSIALQAAERELQEEEGIIPTAIRPPPPTFLHFGPRWHQARRTSTGVLAGYFDQPPRNKPLPIIPGAQHLLARTAAPALSEAEINRMEREKKRLEAGNANNTRSSVTKPKGHAADQLPGVVVANSKRPPNRSSTRSDSPLTDARVLSDDSSPPLTPMTSRSEISRQEDKRANGKRKGEPERSKAAQEERSSSRAKSASRTAKPIRITEDESDNRTGLKRKISEIDRLEEISNASKPLAQRRKSRPGWKGWVEVEGSPEPKDKLINLDFPVETFGSRTRSGKVMPQNDLVLPRVRKASTTKSSSRGASNTPAPGDISPLGPGVRHTNTTIEDSPGEV
ncbi:hypothetical protein CPB86DRAFT_753255 [Serendipita vermifera]|nr:hypothetical protein CPB86DRAFT_753255 [Serendipita vermifera]